MAFLEINQLHKSFGSTDVLKGIDIQLDEGGFLVLIGPSGCGKSTLLNTIAGLEDITSGEIKINSKQVNTLPPAQRDIAMVFQSYALYPNMNVAQNIGFGLEMRGVAKAQRTEAIERVAQLLQITPLLKRRPGQLSGGQRQRVAMGRALVRDPQVFLFDEPLSNLDAKLRVDMRVEIKKLHQELGTTIVYVTHDQIEAMTLATQIAVLKDGILQQVGTPDDVYNRPKNTFVADFMGSPAMNRLQAQVEVQGDNTLVHWDGHSLPVPQASETLRARNGQDVIFGIRPEDVTDPESAHSGSQGLCHLKRRLKISEPTGADTYIITGDTELQLTGRLRAGMSARSGDDLDLTIDMCKAHFFEPTSGVRI